MRMFIWMSQARFGVKARAAAISLLLTMWGCGSMNAHCAAEHDQCQARCQRLRDPKPCEVVCEEAGAACAAQTASRGSQQHRAALKRVEKVMLIDFAGQPLHSAEVKLELGGGAKAQPLWLELPPGGTISATFQLPAEIKAATLMLSHAPTDQKPVFLTITVDEVALAKRYSPARRPDNQLRIEQWPLNTARRAPNAPVKIFIYNNKAAQSLGVHRIKEIHLSYEEIKQAEPK